MSSNIQPRTYPSLDRLQDCEITHHQHDLYGFVHDMMWLIKVSELSPQQAFERLDKYARLKKEDL